MKNILVATDLSHRSHSAVERAAQLANRHSAHLTVLHVIEEYIPDDLAGKRREATSGLLSTYVKGIDILHDVAYDTRIEFGDAWREVVAVADELNADLIVVGRHKTARVRDMFRGATMDLIIRQSHVPTLIAASSKALDYKRVVAAIDFSDAATKAFNLGLQVAPDAEALAIHVRHGGDFNRLRPGKKASPEERLQEILKGVNDGGRIRVLIEEGSPDATLRQFLKNDGEHLITMGVHGRLGIGPMGGLTELFARKPPCDVLLIQPDN